MNTKYALAFCLWGVASTALWAEETRKLTFPPEQGASTQPQYPTGWPQQTAPTYPYAGYAYPAYGVYPYAPAYPYAYRYPSYGYTYPLAMNPYALRPPMLAPYALRPPVPQQPPKKETKPWGDTRYIWPDFYTDFTGDMWDKMINAPYEMGYMPGGWRFPSFSSPDPVTVADAVANQVPPFAEEAGKMVPFEDMGNLKPF